MFIPSLYSRTEGQNTTWLILFVVANLICMIAVNVYGNRQSEQFIFARTPGLDVDQIPQYVDLPASSKSWVYTNTVYWWHTFFLDKYKMVVYTFVVLGCIIGYKRPSSYVMAISILIVQLISDLIRNLWIWDSLIFHPDTTALCRNYVIPYGGPCNSEFRWWVYSMSAFTVLSMVMFGQLLALFYRAKVQTRAEYLEGVQAIGAQHENNDSPGLPTTAPLRDVYVHDDANDNTKTEYDRDRNRKPRYSRVPLNTKYDRHRDREDKVVEDVNDEIDDHHRDVFAKELPKRTTSMTPEDRKRNIPVKQFKNVVPTNDDREVLVSNSAAPLMKLFNW